MKDQFLFWGGNDEGAESEEEMESYGQRLRLCAGYSIAWLCT